MFEAQIVQALGGLLSVVVAAVIGVVTPKLKKYLDTHTTAKTAAITNEAMDGITRIVESVVYDFNQRIVDDVKAKGAGAWTPELAKQIKLDAIAAVQSQAASFIALAQQTYGDVQPLISTLIEQAVAKAKGSKQ